MPHDPQCWGFFARFTHCELQHSCDGGQHHPAQTVRSAVQPQAPSKHCWLFWHLSRHEEQSLFVPSCVGFPSQQRHPAGTASPHVRQSVSVPRVVHWPLQHTSVKGSQAWPGQPPQNEGSVKGSMQIPAHSMSPFGHAQVQSWSGLRVWPYAGHVSLLSHLQTQASWSNTRPSPQSTFSS